jgi:energy-coupling factor transporter ATP-binding protein EcfA2
MDDKTIYTTEGDPIPWFPKDVNNHLDKTTLIFGGTGSGKTTVIEEILYLLKDYVPNFMVIAPRTSDAAYRRKLPSRCIKEDFTKERLQKLWNRQYYATQLYNTANDINILESLFKVAPDREGIVMLEAIKRKASDMIKVIEMSPNLDFGQKKAQKTAIEELQIKKIKIIYRDAVRKNKHIIERNPDLTTQQKIALDYLDFNPRLCLIIDDCSEKFQVWMKFFKKNEVNPFESIFYKNRWNYLTLVFAAHDDKLVNTELRKNSRVTIYTNSQALVTSINRAGNGFTPKEKKEAMRYAAKIFGDEEKGVKTHQKMCYIREDPHPFKYLIANLYPDFNLACTPVRTMVAKMPKKEDNLAANPFVKDLFKKEKNKFAF